MEAVAVQQPYDSMDELLRDNSKIEYKEIESLQPGRSAWIVSLVAEDMMDWAEINEQDKDKKREAGLRLITKSLIKITRNQQGEIVSHEYISSEADIVRLRKVRAAVTEKVIGAILEFNNMTPKKEAAAKNG